ncbi:hypothetical protein PF005_g13878 [Phytophthora fragariae]|uniref:Uncharacterized protein n=2 Tax=Phytophthora TaxID=4783 RepID=A0A6A3ESL3_9STRA|nr:hypothetical protein PF003_g37540 [Phytophthora fragariae]KAE8997509.1 hypothetical protein PR002_g19014 [Phytophthora rubi]KAE8934470.1 hypothetical protein PF009_g15556 [Phytophthora fragariae]KAE9017756.1 hypothetical protein PR001_g14309 [Phytophthora rubi]KAE9103406.1 hypothetical protein PF007_g14416 [Phytophthora fragariae]
MVFRLAQRGFFGIGNVWTTRSLVFVCVSCASSLHPSRRMLDVSVNSLSTASSSACSSSSSGCTGKGPIGPSKSTVVLDARALCPLEIYQKLCACTCTEVCSFRML